MDSNRIKNNSASKLTIQQRAKSALALGKIGNRMKPLIKNNLPLELAQTICTVYFMNLYNIFQPDDNVTFAPIQPSPNKFGQRKT